MRTTWIFACTVAMTVALGSAAQSQEGSGSEAASIGGAEGTALPALGQPCEEGVECPAGLICASGECQLDCDDSAQHIYFDFDEARIRPDQAQILDHVAACMAAAPNRRIRVEGHTDERGTYELNLALSEREANAVRRYLEHRGVDASRIETVHYGEDRPLCTDHDESCWRRNRRAELHWITSLPAEP